MNLLFPFRGTIERTWVGREGTYYLFKSFCNKSNLRYLNRKKIISSAIYQGSGARENKRAESKAVNEKDKIGWKIFTEGVWSQLREKSGGVRVLVVNLDESLEQIKDHAIKLFFPKDGNSKKFGHLNSYSFKLDDFSCDGIEDLTKSMATYVEEIKMYGRIRLYLLAEKKAFMKKSDKMLTNNDSDDDFEEFPFHKRIKKIEPEEGKKSSLRVFFWF